MQEAGGAVGEEDVEAMAVRVRRSLHAMEAREARRNSIEGSQAASRERKAIDARLAEVVARLELTHEGIKIAEAGSIKGETIHGTYRVTAGDNLGDPAIFFGAGSTAGVQGEKLTLCCGSVADWGRLADVRDLNRYELELAEDDTTWRWVEDGTGRHYTSAELADEALRRLFESMRDAARPSSRGGGSSWR